MRAILEFIQRRTRIANCQKGNGFQLEYMERTKAISTLEFIENEYSNDNSKKNITQVFDAAVFDYSKPVELLKTITSYATSMSDVVLDFSLVPLLLPML